MNALANFLVTLDVFPKEISFLVKSRDKHKTVCGGIATVLILALVLTYLVLMLIEPLKFSSSVVNSSTTITSIDGGSTSNNSEISIQNKYRFTQSTIFANMSYNYKSNFPIKYGFMFAMKFLNNPIDPTKLSIDIYSLRVNSSGGYVNPIPIVQCTKDMFPAELWYEFDDYNLGTDFV